MSSMSAARLFAVSGRSGTCFQRITAAAMPPASRWGPGKLPRRRTRRSSASVGLLEERVHVGSELVVVLEDEAVGRVRVDREPRVWE
jgi:hypothetical protein